MNTKHSMFDEITHFIGGKMVKGNSTRYSDVYNPSIGKVIGKCPLANSEEVNEAIQIAHKAFTEWQRTSQGTRVEVVSRFRSLLNERKDELAEIIGVENGKTINDAKGGIIRALESVDLAISAPHLLKGEYSVNVGGDIDVFSMREPLGVVVAISPFNFPVMVPIAMSTMAIAVGNSVVLKPSEKVPNSALFIAELWQEAGLPDGVWTVINGDKEAVDTLISHELIQAISFVGSTQIAQYIYKTGAEHHKRVAAFGSGKNPMIIMPDADMDYAVNAFMGAAYGAASQRCMALSVAMPVGEETADKFVAKVKAKLATLKIGPYNENVDFGPLISEEARKAVLNSIEKAVEDGAALVVDGRRSSMPEEGFYLGPTLFDHVKPNMDIYKEEVFGPARIVVRTNSLDEAIQLVNNHQYGNGVTIFTNNGQASAQFKQRIHAGMIGVNVPVPIPVGYHNFGGLKASKFGEAHMFGPDAARFFTKLKTVSERWPHSLEQEESSMFTFLKEK